MRVLAKVKVVDQLVSGQSDNGNDWERQLVVVETQEDMGPKIYAVDFMGARKTKVTKTLKEGDWVEVDFVINCREYHDKWYTKLDGLSIVRLQRRQEDEEQQVLEVPPAQEPAEGELLY